MSGGFHANTRDDRRSSDVTFAGAQLNDAARIQRALVKQTRRVDAVLLRQTCTGRRVTREQAYEGMLPRQSNG